MSKKKKEDDLSEETKKILIGKGKPKPEDPKPEDPGAHVYSRKGKGSAKGRRRYTTMLHPELRICLQDHAGRISRDEYVSLADIVEEALIEYLQKRSALPEDALRKIIADRK